MPTMELTDELSELNGGFEPQTVIIRHGLFWYFAAEKQPMVDEKTKRVKEELTLVQRTASQNDEIVLVLESDYVRGVQHHAFWTDEELAQARALRAREDVHGPIAAAQEPLSVQAPDSRLLAKSGAEDDDDVPQPLSYDLNEFDEPGDLIEWIQGTGTFDEMRPPNAQEVVKAAQGDKALAARLLEAEPAARGDQGPRETVMKGLKKIIEAD